jgi:hypothetical protein
MIWAAAVAFALMQAAPAQPLVLKAGTPVRLAVAEEVNSKTHQQGTRFNLSVAEDVVVEGRVAIPRGSPAVGEVARHVAKGAFGKAGKLDIQLLHVVVGDRRIRLDGELKQRGRGAAVPAAAVGVVVAGVLGSAIVGKNASIPAGSLVTGYVHRDIALLGSQN